MLKRIKLELVAIAMWFDSCPDWFKKLVYYSIMVISVNVIAALNNKFSADSVMAPILGALLTEITKWGKSKGVDAGVQMVN